MDFVQTIDVVFELYSLLATNAYKCFKKWWLVAKTSEERTVDESKSNHSFASKKTQF